ncbi:MAG TPA: hybrid sensor histidine kinase/response regulator [Burkholderiaceae bacterium]|nr:hybrid sensor histidine kinase/response regulator [Burkholderiaceae bacterium]
MIGASLYLQGTFIKNMAYSKITMLVPFLILAPITVAFFLKSDPLHTTIAIYLTLSLIGLTIYAPNIAKTIHEPIKQRFQMEELAQQLNFERDRADTANIAKSKFFTAASHDARQPLQVISLLFQSFQKSVHASAEDKKIIEKIALNLTTIRNLFDRVLDISRIDAGKVVPVRQTFELQKLFDKFDAQFGELAATKGLWMRFVPTKVVIEHDLELLERILSNLIHNAIKYTPSGGVWIAWRGMRGRLEIRDSGLGIAKEDQEAIFQEFAQINNPARNNEAGLGLGLSIVKRLAALSDTDIGVNSSLGRGSTFWIKLQTENHPASAPEAFHQKSEMNTEPRAKPIQHDDRTLAGLNILYVEDEEQIRELIVELLKDAGASVHAFSNVSDAINFIQKSPSIDVVLTDYRLGVTGSGLDVVNAARMKANEHGKTAIPAVILTGDTAVKDLISIQQLPNSRLLHKPVDFSDLVMALKN